MAAPRFFCHLVFSRFLSPALAWLIRRRLFRADNLLDPGLADLVGHGVSNIGEPGTRQVHLGLEHVQADGLTERYKAWELA